ncbi:TonB-dependent receptor [Caulobacter sp. CCNWLY153]|uniref:TonB-dependent receptor n=1 Tax=unclassified Caulobacter TaxID=2648921 RepID=UPI002FF3DFD9
MDRRILIGSLSMMVLAAAMGANAQEATTSQAAEIEAVIVTSQKRAENVQDVPVSMVALSGGQLEKAGIGNITQLQNAVPNFNVRTPLQAAGVTLVVRGFGTASNSAIDPDVAAYMDGVYIPRPGAILAGFLDVQSVQVLRGPQGTLSGRNATVGAVEITSNAPSFAGRSAEGSLEAASFDTFKGTLVANAPLGKALAIRGTAQASKTSGAIHNALDGKTYGGATATAARLSAKWEIAPPLTWLGRIDGARTTGDGVVANALDVATAPAAQLAAFRSRIAAAGGAFALTGKESLNTNQRLDSANFDDRQSGVSSELSFDFADGFEARLINAYRDWRNGQTDGDNLGTTLDIFYRRGDLHSTSQSHELQLISPQDKLLDGRLSFVAGLYYFEEDYSIRTAVNLGADWCRVVSPAAARPACLAGAQAGAFRSLFTQNGRSYAAYAQADYKLADTLTLTLGARQTKDRKTGTYTSSVANVTAASFGAAETTRDLRTENAKPTWRANLSWRPQEDVMAYASYSTGYKSGGSNSASATTVLNAAARAFAPETSDNWEVGVKSELLDRRLQINADVYVMNIYDFQQRSYNGTFFTVRNAGDIRSQGFELSVQYRPDEHVRFDLGLAYLDSYYRSNPTAPGLPGCSATVANSCAGYQATVGGNPLVQDLTGRPNSQSPKWQGNFGLEYKTSPFAGGYVVSLRPDVSYVGRFYSTVDDNPQGIVKSHVVANLRASLTTPDDRWTLTAYINNIADERFWVMKYAQPLASNFGGNDAVTGASLLRGYAGAPRTVGVKVAAKF